MSLASGGCNFARCYESFAQKRIADNLIIFQVFFPKYFRRFANHSLRFCRTALFKPYRCQGDLNLGDICFFSEFLPQRQRLVVVLLGCGSVSFDERQVTETRKCKPNLMFVVHAARDIQSLLVLLLSAGQISSNREHSGSSAQSVCHPGFVLGLCVSCASAVEPALSTGQLPFFQERLPGIR